MKGLVGENSSSKWDGGEWCHTCKLMTYLMTSLIYDPLFRSFSLNLSNWKFHCPASPYPSLKDEKGIGPLPIKRQCTGKSVSHLPGGARDTFHNTV